MAPQTRWTKRMDEAVASSWLRGLRSHGKVQRTSSAQRLLAGTPRPGAPLRNLDGPVATAER